MRGLTLLRFEDSLLVTLKKYIPMANKIIKSIRSTKHSLATTSKFPLMSLSNPALHESQSKHKTLGSLSHASQSGILL